VTDHDRIRSDGHHDTVYVATLAELSVRLDGGEFDVDVECRDPTADVTGDQEDPADRLTRLWEEL